MRDIRQPVVSCRKSLIFRARDIARAAITSIAAARDAYDTLNRRVNGPECEPMVHAYR